MGTHALQKLSVIAPWCGPFPNIVVSHPTRATKNQRGVCTAAGGSRAIATGCMQRSYREGDGGVSHARGPPNRGETALYPARDVPQRFPMHAAAWRALVQLPLSLGGGMLCGA